MSGPSGPGLVAELLRLKPELESAGVSAMALFGSRARGDHHSDSDIDLLIEVAAGRRFSLLDLIGVGHIVEDRFGLPANVFLRRSVPDYILDRAAAEKIDVFG